MKFIRYAYQDKVYYGVLSNHTVREISGNFLQDWSYTGKDYSLEQVKLLAPVIPSKIVGIGANYVQHVDDLPDKRPDIPVFFFKPPTSVIGPDEEIVIPAGIDSIKFESELAVVIGKQCKNIESETALDYVFGYSVANDITAPQFFREDGHWTIGKAFDTFTPIGPSIETEIDLSNLYVKAQVNGDEKQNSSTQLMIVPIKEMISYLSKVMTLLPGDVILTGSPPGAEFIGDQDTIACTIDQIGTLKNRVKKM